MNNNSFQIAVDIGSPRCTNKSPDGKIGWYIDEENCGNIKTFASAIECKRYFAIGIEAPIFIPVKGFLNFTKARPFDGRRPWSASAGAYTATIALPFIDQCLNAIKKTSSEIVITTDYNYWKEQNDNCVLFWEAFISDSSKPDDSEQGGDEHIRDAKKACEAFKTLLRGSTSPEQSIMVELQDYIAVPEILAKRNNMTFQGNKGLIVRPI